MPRSGTARPATPKDGQDQEDGHDQKSLGDLVGLALKDVSQLVHHEIDLAKKELRLDLRRIAIIGSLVGFAVFVAFFMLLLLSFALAYGLYAAGIPGGGGLYVCFVYAAVIYLLLALATVGIAVLVVRRVTGMKLTKKTVTDDIGMLKRARSGDGESAPAITQ
ncbi:MAG: phage holin family protein [Nocardiopsaceae bacterium]|nr:phage holin family protein [Nocardiopsaceae bacterium]